MDIACIAEIPISEKEQFAFDLHLFYLRLDSLGISKIGEGWEVVRYDGEGDFGRTMWLGRMRWACVCMWIHHPYKGRKFHISSA